MSKDFVSYDTKIIPTSEYDSFEYAFDYFNNRLFGGQLPLVLITYQRGKRYNGYYSHERFAERRGDEKTSEIALNPDSFEARTDKEILGTLVHEMCHLWQGFFGESSRNNYHNKEWAAMMESIGLMPSATGEPGDKRTGQKMTHYIITGGAFDYAADNLLNSGFELTWQSKKDGSDNKPGGKKDKLKYTCPTCGANAWGKSGLNLLCGDCMQPMATDEDECKKNVDARVVSSQLGEPSLLTDIRQRLNGLNGIAINQAASDIAEEEIGDHLCEFNLSFDYFENVWIFVDDQGDVVEEAAAVDWADAIVQAKAQLERVLCSTA